MTQMFRPDGQAVPVTSAQAGPCTVVQRKTPTTMGMTPCSSGCGVRQAAADQQTRHGPSQNKAGAEGQQIPARVPPGDRRRRFQARRQVLVDQFKPKDQSDVIGVQQGPRLRRPGEAHHSRGGEGTHGRCSIAAPGSIGASITPRVWCRECAWRATWAMRASRLRNLEVMEVDTETNVLVVKARCPDPMAATWSCGGPRGNPDATVDVVDLNI